MERPNFDSFLFPLFFLISEKKVTWIDPEGSGEMEARFGRSTVYLYYIKEIDFD